MERINNEEFKYSRISASKFSLKLDPTTTTTAAATGRIYPDLSLLGCKQPPPLKCFSCMNENAQELCPHDICKNCACFICYPPKELSGSITAQCPSCTAMALNLRVCDHCHAAICPDCAKKHRDQIKTIIESTAMRISKTQSYTPAKTEDLSLRTAVENLEKILALKKEAHEQIDQYYAGLEQRLKEDAELALQYQRSQTFIFEHAKKLANYLYGLAAELTKTSYILPATLQHYTHLVTAFDSRPAIEKTPIMKSPPIALVSDNFVIKVYNV